MVTTSHNNQEGMTKLIAIIQKAIDQDEALRLKYQIGNKFKFIRDQLNAILEKIKEESSGMKVSEKNLEPKKIVVAEDEDIVFVHLYNAEGHTIRGWQSVITPKAFFDFSVNRPIYKDKKHVESFIHNKPSRIQHGYLVVAIKKNLIVSSDILKDSLGNPLLKVKEGALQKDRLIAFFHNEIEYQLADNGDLIKKPA